MNNFAEALKQAFNPKNIIRELVTLKKTTTVLMLVMIFVNVIAFIVGHTFNFIGYLGLATGIITVLNLVLIDQGRLTNYFWGAINCGISLLISLDNRLFGDIASQIFYFTFQFVGLYFWHKQLEEQTDNHEEVKSRKITPLKAFLAIMGVIVLYLIVLFTSKNLHGNQVYLDSLLLPLGIIGQILMTYGYASQWYAWILIDSLNIYIWAVQLQNGGTAAFSMLVLQIIMWINAIYGCYLWYKNS